MQTQKYIDQEANVWRFDPAYSSVEFSVKKLFFFTVHGKFKAFDGAIALDEADLSRSSVKATLKAESIDTGNSRRDAQLKDQGFLEVDRYPEVTFTSSSVAHGKDRDSLDVVGDLCIKGTTKKIPLAVNAIDRSRSPNGEEFVYYSATAELDRCDFGINAFKGVVGRKLKITINVQASRKR
jgi:polyisoprenoid-binding protein YceI